jgi:hypothetical protein
METGTRPEPELSDTERLRMTPQRLFSFAEAAWQGVTPTS